MFKSRVVKFEEVDWDRWCMSRPSDSFDNCHSHICRTCARFAVEVVARHDPCESLHTALDSGVPTCPADANRGTPVGRSWGNFRWDAPMLVPKCRGAATVCSHPTVHSNKPKIMTLVIQCNHSGYQSSLWTLSRSDSGISPSTGHKSKYPNACSVYPQSSSLVASVTHTFLPYSSLSLSRSFPSTLSILYYYIISLSL